MGQIRPTATARTDVGLMRARATRPWRSRSLPRKGVAAAHGDALACDEIILEAFFTSFICLVNQSLFA
jgi:hypothetical protein